MSLSLSLSDGADSNRVINGSLPLLESGERGLDRALVIKGVIDPDAAVLGDCRWILHNYQSVIDCISPWRQGAEVMRVLERSVEESVLGSQVQKVNLVLSLGI